MTFNQSDLYTVSAGTEIFNFWNPFVTKFDSSSFYSWEQDNTPLYDLEEKTDYLWEKLGWPTSSIPGLVLSVSSSIPTHLAVSSNVFTTLQGAVDALPEILRFPTLIEVAVSGDIGELNLDNVKCVGNGALEIINRVFGNLDVGLVDFAKTIGPTATGQIIDTESRDSGNGGLWTSVRDTSCLNTNSQTSSLFFTSDGMAMISNKYLTGAGTNPVGYLNIALTDASNKLTQSPTAVNIESRDISLGSAVQQDTSIDTSGVNSNNTALVPTYGRTTIAANNPVTGIFTGNYLRRIKVSNCDGPIYIRGFLVNSASGGSYPFTPIHNYGIDISNTEGLVVENCGVSRAGVAGLFVSDSSVSLGRKFLCGRNYTQSTRGTVEDYGILAVNSKLTFDQDAYINSVSSTLIVAHQKTGIELVNSQLTGGEAVSPDQVITSVISAQQCEVGISLRSSLIDINGSLDVYNNTKGILAQQSTLITDSIIGQCNTEAALELEESTFEYNKNLSIPTAGIRITSPELPYWLSKNFFLSNGQHIKATSSKIKPTYSTSSMPTKHGEISFLRSVGTDSSSNLYTLPSVELQNSFCELVHPYFWSFSNLGSRRTKGKHLGVLNSSTAILRGSTGGASVFSTYSQDGGTGIHVDGGSNLIAAGPTHISQQDSALLCEDNSTVSFIPHMKSNNKTLAANEWNLVNPANHTSVEVFGRVGCLVANNNSIINMRDLGSWYTNMATQHATDDVYLNSDSPKEDALYTSGGSFTFYPYTTGDGGGDTPSETGYYIKQNKLRADQAYPRIFTSTTAGYGGYNWFLMNSNIETVEDTRTYTNGGVCVKAVNNSTVNAKNVNFICGPVNADEVFLDPTLNTAGGCNDLRIWAIAGGSTLNASQLSVSGNYPDNAGYHGPRGIYYTDTS